MGGAVDNSDRRRSGLSPGVYVAVATASAVTVLAAFSFAVSSLVEGLDPSSPPGLVETALPAVDQNPIVENSGASKTSGTAVPFHIYVALSVSRNAVVRVIAPKGRPLEIEFSGLLGDEPVLFESVDTTVMSGATGEALLTPPLDRGAYPFCTASGRQGGVLIIE